MSFLNDAGEPVGYDEKGHCGMSALTSSFAAGALKYLDAILALTAPAVISYERLTPHRWSAAYNNLGFRDREASLRVCPVTAKDPISIARQFNIEYRAADAAACPHLALAAIVHAGVQGIEEGLSAPNPTEEDLSLLTEDELSSRGFIRLPQTLESALERLNETNIIANWFPETFTEVYSAHKASEIEHLKDMDTTLSVLLTSGLTGSDQFTSPLIRSFTPLLISNAFSLRIGKADISGLNSIPPKKPNSNALPKEAVKRPANTPTIITPYFQYSGAKNLLTFEGDSINPAVPVSCVCFFSTNDVANSNTPSRIFKIPSRFWDSTKPNASVTIKKIGRTINIGLPDLLLFYSKTG